ncbi:YrhB domain-containing protein [Sorangium sp. So ce1036]|uniref:YrhB domain-containing protein n=1 Tax=Sorangium sp. So ce1036 TaxID=3133328 RepID=UPI003F09A3ED
MVTYSEAKDKVLSILKSRSVGGEGGVVILDEKTIEKPYGWVIFYNSRRYVETGELIHSLIGGGPVVVLSETGEVFELGSARPGAVEVEVFERERGLLGK